MSLKILLQKGAFFCFFLFLVLFFIVLALPMFLRTSFGLSFVEKFLEKKMPGVERVHIDALNIHWRGFQQIDGIVCLNIEGERVFFAEKVLLKTSLLSLLKDFPQVGIIEVDFPRAVFFQDEEGIDRPHSFLLNGEKNREKGLSFFSLPVSATFVVREGEVVFVKKDGGEALLEGVSLKMDFLKKGEASLQFQGKSSQRGREGSFQGSFDFVEEEKFSKKRRFFGKEAKFFLKMDDFPTNIIDQLTSIGVPSKEFVTKIVGEQVSVDLQGKVSSQKGNLQLSFHSPLLNGEMFVHSNEESLFFKEGSLFSYILTPESFEILSKNLKFSTPLHLLEKAFLHCSVESLNIPWNWDFTDLSQLSFATKVFLPDAMFSSGKGKFSLQDFEVKCELLKDSDGISNVFSFEIQKEDLRGRVAGNLYAFDFFDSKKKFDLKEGGARWEIDMENLPMGLLGKFDSLPKFIEDLDKEASVKIRGSARDQKSEMDVNVSISELFSSKTRFFWDSELGKLGINTKVKLAEKNKLFTDLLGEEFSIRIDGTQDEKKGFFEGLDTIAIELFGDGVSFKMNGWLEGLERFICSSPAVLEYDLRPALWREMGEKFLIVKDAGILRFFLNPFEISLSESFLKDLHLSGNVTLDSLLMNSSLLGEFSQELLFQQMNIAWDMNIPTSIFEVDAEGYLKGKESLENEEGGKFRFRGNINNFLSREGLYVDLREAGLRIEALMKEIYLKSREGLILSFNELSASLWSSSLIETLVFKAFGRSSLGSSDQSLDRWEYSLDGSVKELFDEKGFSGLVEAKVEGDAISGSVDVHVNEGVLSLRQDLEGTIVVTKNVEKLLSMLSFPFLRKVQLKENPLRIVIFQKGLQWPIFPLTLKALHVEKVFIDLGEVSIEKEGSLFEVILALLKQENSQGSQYLQLWFTPLYMSLHEGVITCNRFDVLLDRLYPLAFWGDVDLGKNQVEMTVGISKNALERALDIRDLEKKYMLQLPFRGEVGRASLKRKQAVLQIGRLLVKEKAGEVGGILGGIMEAAIWETVKQAPEPTTQPFPWE